ncbi:aldolase [Rhodobacteraceae bacterium 2376]|uniref:Aldolase n=1 Tax=Rhabdonatronobacter sediminivivens TaxID=2743469 RepID=A0A7Z0L129_9RHOB|nr:aldolase/citrate lyase family protein [Rhabdonatronobacter sediminivivens]NYS26556.1 aldolase [Rhabdonatronobacter sediminivivens]
MKTLFITAIPEIALHAEGAGVDVIFIDMETRGKAARQGHLDTHKAAHSLADVAALAPRLSRAELMVRVNPPWAGSAQEARNAIAAGATRLMLPMFNHAAEVTAFKQTAGSTPVTLLVETAAALARLPVILPLLGPQDRVHFGLNDLSLDMRLDFLFEVLGGRLLDGPSAQCREAGIAFGIGGVGRVGQGDLPADWILGEHARLGSDWVILSRAFHGRAASLAELQAQIDLSAELCAIRQVADEWLIAPHDALYENHARLARRAAQIARQSENPELSQPEH